jgi:hypothetical protein
MMHRVVALLAVMVIGTVAPARAWCEASCIAPKHDGSAHCPSHEPAGGATSISATGVDECPALETARPIAQARLDAGAVVIPLQGPAPKQSALDSPRIVRPHGATTVFERATPLRI